MSVHETLISAFEMICNKCNCKSQAFQKVSDLISFVKFDGWTTKQFFKDQLAVEEWKCPTCLGKEIAETINNPVQETPKEEEVK